MSAVDFLALARRYVARGVSVVAVAGKHPTHGWHRYIESLPSQTELKTLFAPNGRGAPTGLALVIGPATWQVHAHLYVLEVEAEHRPAAEAWLDEHLPDWRQGLVAESGGGSLHLYLTSPSPVATRRHAWGEVRGHGSITVLPPSLHLSGRPYRWLSRGQPRRCDPDTLPLPGLASGGRLYQAIGDGPVPEGQRNATLTSLAGALRRAGLDAATIEATLQHVNSERCDPPLPPHEVAAIARSIGRKPGGDSSAIYIQPADESKRRMAFRSAAALVASAPEEPPWLWRGFLVEGGLTVLGGREKAGKSTLVFALLRALLEGASFLGQPCRPTAAVLVTEEGDSSVREKLERFGLSKEAKRLSILTRSGLEGQRPTLSEVVAAAAAEAERIAAKVIVIDALSFWSGTRDEQENLAGAMQHALWPVLQATGKGLAVLLLHHLTKGTSELRGSTAIGATADVVITLHRENEQPQRRRLEAVGRYQATPDALLIELSGDAYRPLGAPSVVEAADRERIVREALPVGGDGLTQDELAEATGLPKQRVSEAVRALLAAGDAQRFGSGRRGDPYRYRKLPRNFISSADTTYIADETDQQGFVSSAGIEHIAVADKNIVKSARAQERLASDLTDDMHTPPESKCETPPTADGANPRPPEPPGRQASNKNEAAPERCQRVLRSGRVCGGPWWHLPSGSVECAHCGAPRPASGAGPP